MNLVALLYVDWPAIAALRLPTDVVSELSPSLLPTELSLLEPWRV